MWTEQWKRWSLAMCLALPVQVQAGTVRELPPPEIIRSGTSNAGQVQGLEPSSQGLDRGAAATDGAGGLPVMMVIVEPPPVAELSPVTVAVATPAPGQSRPASSPVERVAPPAPPAAIQGQEASAAKSPEATAVAGVTLAAPTRRSTLTPEDRVIELLGLPRKRPIMRQLQPRGEIRARARERLAPHMPRQTIAARAAMLEAIGLLPQNYDLRAALLDLFPRQVAGLYDLEQGEIGLREDLTSDEKQEALLHELVHAVQDQHFDLEQVIPADLNDEDHARAIRAVVEGQAVWVTTRLSGTSREVVRMGRKTRVPEPTPELLALLGADAPAVLPNTLRDSGTQLYQVGAAFVEAFEARFGAASAVFYAMPTSTEQLIHFDRYLAREKPVQVSIDQVAASVGPGWEPLEAMTLGELNVAFWLGETPGGLASTGWGGDRLMGFTANGRTLAAWRTVWDTEDDAIEFQEAARDRIRHRFPGARFVRQIPNGFILSDGLEAHGVIRLGSEVRVVGGADTDGIEGLLQAVW